jgi:hypothetical protein
MSRTDRKYAVDTLMFLCIVGMVAIGLLMAFVIPGGRAELGRSKYFLGLHRHQWGDIHLYLSLAFTALVAVHIVLSWSWIRGKASCLFRKAWMPVLGLTFLTAAAVPFIFWLGASKNDPAFEEFGTGRGRQAVQAAGAEMQRPELASTVEPSSPEIPAADDPPRSGETAPGQDLHESRVVAGRTEASTAEVVITGQMTLRELERVTGILAGDIAARLGLPAGVSFDETLGRLRQAYGFEMKSLRDAVAALIKDRK